MRKGLVLVLVVMLALSAIGPTVFAQDDVELRMLWYNDGNEGEVMRDLLDRFEEENPGITIEMDVVAFADIHNVLQTSVEGGEPPDLARVADTGRFREFYLDMSGMVADVDYWTSNFAQPVLDSFRLAGDETGIYGFPTQFTVTGPYINATLFDQAGVEIPADDSSWETWVDAAVEVAEITGTQYAVAIDRSGHRFWGPSLSLGATYLNEDGSVTVDSEGFRRAADMLVDWHEREITPIEVWVGSGDQYASAQPEFVNQQLVLYMSGSWQIGGFADTIGDTFDWQVIPNPTGEGGSTGIPGGAVLAAMEGTEHPEEVTLLMDYLASEEILSEFTARSLFIPGHIGLSEAGVPYGDYTDDAAVIAALEGFLAEVPKLSDEAYGLQYSPIGFPLNTAIRDRLTQVIVGEISLDEAIERIQEAADEAFAAQ